MALNTKIKVLHILAGGWLGGAERSTEWFAQVANRQEFDYQFAFLYDGGPIQEAIQKMDFSTHILCWRNGYSLLGRWRLIHLIKRLQPDILHFQDTTPLVKIFIKLFFPSLPIIQTCHGFEPVWRTVEYGTMLDDKWIDLVIANSDYTLMAYSERYYRRRENIIRIYLGLPIEKYNRGVKNERSAKLVSKKCNILFLGRIREEKGVLDLPLLASELLNAGFDNFKINIVGDGPARPKVVERAALLGVNNHVAFLGAQNDVIPFLREADIFVFPSWWEEPFGLVLLEALIFGLGIVAYQTGAVTEVIGGVPGCRIVERRNVKAMARSIMEICANDDYPEPLECAKYVKDNFDISQTVRQVEALYHQFYEDV